MQDPVVVAGMARTPIGNFQGAFTGVAATELGGRAIKAALERAGTRADSVDEALMGCVLPAGLGQAPARQAALAAGLPTSTGCVTLNKVCGSG
ncbi:MAG: acetyl-CoA C-acyltransferase, partial [Parvularculaceae bacterium]|nr:acetyl-CoA C-acyltransferase [Parvularculaceae bacterium]